MKFDIPPVEKSQRFGLLDEIVLGISKDFFAYPLFGYGISGVVNILFLYLCYKRASIISIIIFLFLYYFFIRIVQIKILGL